MFGPTLALFTRALRQDARSLMPHLLRCGLLAVIVWFLIMTHDRAMFVGAPGRDFFGFVAWLNALFISLASISFFATAITEEKEERALGLLLMADVRPVAILIGKSLPRVLAALLLIAVQFPFTLLAVTLGGVTVAQVAAIYLSLLAQTVFLAMLALACSVVCRRSSSANRLMVLWLAVLYVLPPMLVDIPPNRIADPVLVVAEWLWELSVYSRLQEVMWSGFSGPLIDAQVIGNLVGAAVFFALAWLAFDRFGHDTEDEASRGIGRLLSMTLARKNRPFGTRRAWTNALAWKDFHFVVGGVPMMAAKFALYGAFVVGLHLYMDAAWSWRMRRRSLEDFGELTMGIMFWAVIPLEMAAIASRIFLVESRDRTLATLMMLPASTAAICWSKVAGSLPALIPGCVWLLVGAVCAPNPLGDALDDVLTEPTAWFIIMQWLLFIHVVAFLSLIVKWGALPLAIAAFVFFYMGCLFSTRGAMFGRSEEAVLGFLAVMTWIPIIGLEAGIGERLRWLTSRQ